MTIRRNVSAGSSVSFFEEEREVLFAPPAHFHLLHPALCSAGQPLWMHRYNSRPLAPCWAQPWSRVTSRLSEVGTERGGGLYFPAPSLLGLPSSQSQPLSGGSMCGFSSCCYSSLSLTPSDEGGNGFPLSPAPQHHHPLVTSLTLPTYVCVRSHVQLFASP